MGALSSIALFPIAWLSYNAYCLYQNLQQARRLNIPTICVPVSPDNPLWIALQTGLSFLFRYVPLDAFSFTRYCHLGWEFRDRYRTHQRLGDAWVLVTPNKNWIYLAQAEAAVEVYSRNKDFVRCLWMLESMKVFGPSVSTAEGSDWQRQRKLTATPFNEQKSKFVWAESLRQADAMIQSWTSNGDDGSRHTADDVRTLAIDVLAFAGFQKSYPFLSHRQKAELQDEAILSSYRDALAIILRNVLVIIVLPASFFNLPFLPKKWTQIGLAMSAFKKYMLDEVADEKRSISEGKPGSGTLVSNLVQASEQQDQDSKNNSTRMQTLKPLTISEILGNIFVFNFAGHDTTAISLSYALLLLVAHPEVQDWISEEINHYLASPSPDSRNYESTFPKLQRCLAVLFETLRLYNPIPGIPKHTSSNPQTLTLSPNNTLNIPPHTLVCPNLQALHTHPRYWGEDSLLWRPQRWITTSSSPPKDPSLETETLDTPKKGTFIAWSEGLQNCPGKRFAQVEFVAVIVALFRAHRAEVVPAYEGETQGEGRKRVMDAVADSELTLLLGMRDPGAVKVRWVRRG